MRHFIVRSAGAVALVGALTLGTASAFAAEGSGSGVDTADTAPANAMSIATAQQDALAKYPGATIQLGAKDTRLFREAAHSTSTPTPLADLYQQHMQAVIDAGRGGEDWAAGYFGQTRALKS